MTGMVSDEILKASKNEALRMNDKRHPPPAKRHPSTEGNCSNYSPIEGGFRGVCLSLFCLMTFTRSGIFRIDPHATLVAPVEDENTIQKSISPLSKRGLGGFELFLLRHCEERPLRRGNLIYQNFLCSLFIVSG